MSSSGLEELRIDVDEGASHREKQNSNVPHRGKKISKYVFSPNMQYFVTWSNEDKSIVGWTITEHEEFKLKFDNLISSEEFKKIVLVTAKLRQELNAQGLKGHIDSITFLENGDLAIVKKHPVYRVYIFSKSKSNGKQQWTCKDIIKLNKEFYSSFIFKNGRLLLVFEIPSVIMQWNLKTLKLETQYILNWNLYRFSLELKMSGDNKLLAASSCTRGPGTSIHVYSTESGDLVAHGSFKESLHNFCFIGSIEKQLFFSGPRYDTKKYNSYILNPHTLKPQGNKNFLHIYSPTYENYREYQYNITSDFIINLDINDLSIQRLSHNESWKIHFQNQKRYMSNTFFNMKEIKQFAQDILEKFELDQILIQSYSDGPKKLSYGESYTWIIKTIPHSYVNYYHETTVIAINGEKKTNEGRIIAPTDKENSYILKYKLLENGDIIFVYSEGIIVFAVNSQKKILGTIYFWSDGDKNEKETAQQSTKRQLTSFIKKINKSSFKILPPPTYDPNSIDDFMNNELALKLYGKDLLYQLAQMRHVKIESLFPIWLDYGISAFERGDTYNFMLFTSQIAFTLIKLEEYNKNKKFTERFLSKINLLAPGNTVKNYSILSHLHHCEIYDHMSLSRFSSFNYWILERWNLLKKNYPKFYKYLASTYLYCSDYFTNNSQKTVTLIIPLLNFATYPEEYSYLELFYLPDNSFTSLDAPDYYKCGILKLSLTSSGELMEDDIIL
ncbi:hypothetical protein F8M41_004251 [Gigaspora margarita]|uniref:Uncharacterized protein n=1 Tax=Gigaspora margarita TaxID=4874 RepID=A0A8H3XA03_GIGMA|nr:hypothetical protein F8M41_004251 [Gigaspora margarita]